jgi:hypothetical protein
MYNNYYIYNKIKKVCINMIVIGLLSTKQEVEEIKYIAKICDVENRIRFVVRKQRIKELLNKDCELRKE